MSWATARTALFHQGRRGYRGCLEMVKIAWELLTTFNCWQLLNSSRVGQWGRKNPWQAGGNYSLRLTASPVEPGLALALSRPWVWSLA